MQSINDFHKKFGTLITFVIRSSSD